MLNLTQHVECCHPNFLKTNAIYIYVSDGEEQEDSIGEEHPPSTSPSPLKLPTNNNVQDLLKRLQSTGALLKKPKQEFYCYTCKEDFEDWEDLEHHLLTHISLPSIVVDKLPSEDEDMPSGDEEWSDEDEAPAPKTPIKTPQKVDISQLLKNTGLSLKKPTETPKTSNLALDKLSGLGFTIKKSTSPIKKESEIKIEPSDSKMESQKKSNDVLQRLGNLGGIKLKLKSDGNNANSFKVVNGLKDFKASDDEDDDDDEDMDKNASQDADSDEEPDKSGEQEGSDAEDSDEEDIPLDQNIKQNLAQSKQTALAAEKIANNFKNIPGKSVVTKMEPHQSPVKPVKPAPVAKTPSKDAPPKKPVGRPNMKQTPKRGANLPLPAREPMKITEITSPGNTSLNSTPERRLSDAETVVVKKEVETLEAQPAANSFPLFSGQIKTEASSPPPTEDKTTPLPQIASVKSEPEPVSTSQAQSLFSNRPVVTAPLLPVTKMEDTDVTIIEINGDSNDEDDDCCVVSATPASDVKPILPKTEPVLPTYPPPVYLPTSQSSYTTTVPPTSRASLSSLEKQHHFNWNAPDTKPAIDIFEKSADDIFESLISNATKKENMSDASEYISLDTLGPQHSCDVCNTRFTDLSLLENHIRMTGHSRSLVTPSSTSTLMPYNPGSSSILSSLLPVKQMVEHVGKLGMGSTAGFTHQQNVMINIQAYPGAGGMMPPQPNYNSYGQPQQSVPGYGQTASGMYGAAPGQPMPGQFSNQNYMGQQPYGQFQNAMPQNSFETPMYQNSSPLQGMQQQVYRQPATSMSSQMGPPPVPTSNPYSTPGGNMKAPTSGNAIKIQNIQTFSPGQVISSDGAMMPPPAPGQMMGGQMHSPGQIRMTSGANVSGPRPRMPGVRGQRPTIRPGIQVHGQVRGAKPGVRMPMKRPGASTASPAMKKRPNILLPGKHDNEDCQVMAMQKQREGMPLIKSVQGAGEKLNLGSQISITKKTVNKEANAMANVLASRGISIKQKQKSRSPSPERPLPHIPNLGAGMSIKHTSKSSNFTIPEAKVGGMIQCRICKKMFSSQNSLALHMSSSHPQSKIPMFKCEECPASYPKILQLQHHKRVFHNVMGPNRELGLPVVDMSQEDNLTRLNSLGIYSYIPLASKDQGGGCFGIPVISVHNVQNGMTSSLQALGADGLLSLGPLKSLPNT